MLWGMEALNNLRELRASVRDFLYYNEIWDSLGGGVSHGGTENTEEGSSNTGGSGRCGMEGMFLTENMRGVFIGS